MAVKQFLQKNQAVAYQTIANGFIRHKTSHAYLLAGSQGSPLKAMGIFLAQSFLCEQSDPLACEACLTCIRVEDGNYIDFTLVDGALASIKKEDIDNLQADFSKTALEIAGKKVYFIHLLENASIGAINSILKFLEEPGDNVIGILSTQNVSKILPTIVSRCQLIRLKNTTKLGLIEELTEKGVALEDARLLVQDKTTSEEIEAILADDHFHLLKDLAIASLKQLVAEEASIHYFVQRDVIPNIGSRTNLYVYLQVLETLFRDLTYRDYPAKLVFANLQAVYANWNPKFDVHQMLEIIMYAKGSIDNNVNAALALDRLYYEMMLCQ